MTTLAILPWLILLVDLCWGVSYNQPRFSACATWNATAVTIANHSFIGPSPLGVFVHTNNTIYLLSTANATVYVWPATSSTPTSSITGNMTGPLSFFVGDEGDAYVATGGNAWRVDRWRVNSSTRETILVTDSHCYGLFLDLNETVYCSQRLKNQVIKKAMNQSIGNSSIAAGTGCAGSTATSLTFPSGIFVHVNFDLYVADSGNHRIQLFEHNQLNGTTVAGNGAPGTISLRYPIGIVLDGDGYLFIVDSNNARLVRSGAHGFQCIAACFGSPGGTALMLNQPQTISLDSYGNIFVVDRNNHRILKFALVTNHCEHSSTQSALTAAMEEDVTSAELTTTPTSTLNPAVARSSMHVSYNQPKFSSCATWHDEGLTFANITMAGWHSQGLFVDKDDTVYVMPISGTVVAMWLQGNAALRRNISVWVREPMSLFVTTSRELLIDDGGRSSRVNGWSANGTALSPVMHVPGSCRGLFVDVNQAVYCSVAVVHQVFRTSSSSNTYQPVVVAGTGCRGGSADMLGFPYGIFVDTNLDLYVADYINDRIQRFPLGQRNATTVVGVRGIFNVTLSRPTGIALDADGNLFVVESNNHRITMVGFSGIRCIVGCSGMSGNASDQLNLPNSMSFDSHGNIFVADLLSNRLQKFFLARNTCVTTYTHSTTWITQAMTTSHSVSISIMATCSNSWFIGANCNISSAVCDVLIPCLNGGACIDDMAAPQRYRCNCSAGFNGTECQVDIQPCRAEICWNSGVCVNKSLNDFLCECPQDWEGTHCETKVNYCGNVTCQNSGICRSMVGGYECDCLNNSYSGRHCEVKASNLEVREKLSQSLGYIAAVFLVGVFLFVFFLDLLKYAFHIDPLRDDLERQRAKVNAAKNRVAVRFLYLHKGGTPVVAKVF